jgi:hypothetical protein
VGGGAAVSTSRSPFVAVMVALAAAPGCGCDDGPAPAGAAAPASEARMALELRADTPRVKAGDDPQFTVTLVNRGAEPVTIVLPGDGSDMAWRTPVVRRGPPGPDLRKCGNVNPLRADEVVTMAPGERRRLSAWLGAPVLEGKGKNKVSLELENDPDFRWRG